MVKIFLDIPCITQQKDLFTTPTATKSQRKEFTQKIQICLVK